ncbi:MAG: T9SS type A sorting domain-containing protein, partial [Ignavibacteria bacterium]|nr:T9SS type A sorting domain-containing protein [Ignavibacteria bacterium]
MCIRDRFVTEPTGNTRFAPGKFIFMRIALNDGGTGTTVASRITSTDSVRVVTLATNMSDSTGTGLRGMSLAPPKDFVYVYDNVNGDGRPISATFIESDGTDNSLSNNYSAFYANNVNNVNGAFGLVLPNILPNGIRRVERRSLTNGSIENFITDNDGVWQSGANTVNPSGGTSEIVLTSVDVPLIVSVDDKENLPTKYQLYQNYPNPFNPFTIIKYQLPTKDYVQIKVFSLLGAELMTLVDGMKEAGIHQVKFDAKSLASGIYYYTMRTNGFVQSKSMIILK